MELPTAYQAKFEVKSTGQPRSPWEEQLDNFLARLNPSRKSAGYVEYSHARLAGDLAKMGIHDAAGAFQFYRQCEQARSFSALFHWKLKHAV